MNFQYSAKQNFRKYKTYKEPNIMKKIKIKEDQLLIKKIREAFGIKPENTNFTNVETFLIANSNPIALKEEKDETKMTAKEKYEKYLKLYPPSSNLSLSLDLDNHKEKKTQFNEKIGKKLKEKEEYSIKAKEEFIDKMMNLSNIPANNSSSIYNYKTREKPDYKKHR